MVDQSIFIGKPKEEGELFHQYALTLPKIDMSKWEMADVPQDIDTAIGGLVNE